METVFRIQRSEWTVLNNGEQVFKQKYLYERLFSTKEVAKKHCPNNYENEFEHVEFDIIEQPVEFN